MGERVYGGNKASYGVIRRDDGWIELRVYQDNQSVRRVLRHCIGRPRALLYRKWQGARAAHWMAHVIRDFRPYFEQGRVKIILVDCGTGQKSTMLGGAQKASVAAPVQARAETAHRPTPSESATGNSLFSPIEAFCRWLRRALGAALGARGTAVPDEPEGQTVFTAEESRLAPAVSLHSAIECLVHPRMLWNRHKVLNAGRCPVPEAPGLYGWYFRTLPDPRIAVERCVVHEDCYLLYVGIAPENDRSSTSLRSRIIDHYRNWTTLRMTLGSLLAEELGLAPRNKNLQWNHEDRLSAWMSENAFVVWVEHPQPWHIEREIIRTLDLPLNIQHNRDHPFCPVVMAARRRQRDVATPF